MAIFLTGVNFEVFANQKLFLSVPGGTMYCDPQGGRYFYEGLCEHQVSSYHTSYWDTVNSAIQTSIGLLAMVVGMTMGNPAGVVIAPTASYFSRIILPPGGAMPLESNIAAHMMFWISAMMLYGNIKEHVHLASNYAFPGEDDNKYTFTILATSEKGISPLLIQPIFSTTTPFRFFYRISAPSIIDEETSLIRQYTSAVYYTLPFTTPALLFDESNPLVNRLVAALRQRNVYMELELFYADAQGVHDAFNSYTLPGIREQGRLVRVVFYDQGQARLPRVVTFTAPDDINWIEDLLSIHFHHSYVLNKHGVYAINANEPETNLSSSAFRAGLVNKRFDSPLSPDWLQHIAGWLENESNWDFSKDSHGGPYPGQAGPEYRDECDNEGQCISHYLASEPDENGCLALGLNGLIYYLPGNLANPLISAQPSGSHCFALLPGSTGLFAQQTYFSSNLRNNHRLLYFDKLGKDLTVTGLLALFGKAMRHIAQQSVSGGVAVAEPPPLPGVESVAPGSVSSGTLLPIVAAVTELQAPVTLTGHSVETPPAEISKSVDATSMVTAQGLTLTLRQEVLPMVLMAVTTHEKTTHEKTTHEPVSSDEPDGVVERMSTSEESLTEDSPTETSPTEEEVTPSLDDILAASEGGGSESEDSEDLNLSLYSQDEDSISIVSGVSVFTALPQTETYVHGSLTFGISQSRFWKQFKPGDNDNIQEFRARGRFEAAQMTVVGHLVNRGWEAVDSGETLEPLGWKTFVESVMEPEFERLRIKSLPSERDRKHLHRLYDSAIKIYGHNYRSAARYIVIYLAAEAKALEKFNTDTEVFAGSSDSATARIAATVVSLNSLKEEPFGSYRSFLSSSIRQMRMFSSLEQDDAISRYSALFALLGEYAHGRSGQPVNDYEFKSIVLGSWPQSREHLQTELKEVRRRQEESVKVEVGRKLTILARKAFAEARQSDNPGFREADIDEKSEEYQDIYKNVKSVHQDQVEGELMQQVEKEVELGVANYGLLQQDIVHHLHYFPDMIEILDEVKKSRHLTRKDEFANLDSDHDSDIRQMRNLMPQIYKELLIKHIWKHHLKGRFDLDDRELRHILGRYRDSQQALRVEGFRRMSNKKDKVKHLADLLDARESEKTVLESSPIFDKQSLAVMKSYYDLSSGEGGDPEFSRQFLEGSQGLDELYAGLEKWGHAETYDIDDLVAQAENLAFEVKERAREARSKKDKVVEKTNKDNSESEFRRGNKKRRVFRRSLKIEPIKEKRTEQELVKGRERSQTGQVVSSDSLESQVTVESDAERRLRELPKRLPKKHAQKRKTPISDLEPELRLAARDIEGGMYWKDVVEVRARRMTREAILVSKDEKWHSHDIPKFDSSELMDFPQPDPLWNPEQLQIAKRLKKMAFEKVVKSKTADKDGAHPRLLQATMQFLNRQSIIQRVREQTVTFWILPLLKHGYITLEPGEEINYTNFVNKDQSDPMVQWYLDKMHEVVESEYTQAIKLFEDIQCLTKMRSRHVGLPDTYGKKPVESFVEGGKGTHEKAQTRLVRLESILYTYRVVNPWYERAMPYHKIFDQWKNNSRLKQVDDAGPLLEHYEVVKQLRVEGQVLEQYKMPEQRWREVAQVLNSLDRLVKACDKHQGESVQVLAEDNDEMGAENED